jgi:NitT/TauT family transport system substrate-binding protein
MTDTLIDNEVRAFTDLKIIDSGDALARGIGAIDMRQVQSFLDEVVRAGLYKAGEIDVTRAVTDRFVNKGVGLDVRKALGR